MLNLAQKYNGDMEERFASASDYLETRDDSDNITAINAQKIWDILQKWWHNHSTSQYQGSEASYEHMEVVGTELRLELNNPRQLWFSNTSSCEIEEKPSS